MPAQTTLSQSSTRLQPVKKLANEAIFNNEEAWFEQHLKAQHESNFFANLNPGAPFDMPPTYCAQCETLASIAVAAVITEMAA